MRQKIWKNSTTWCYKTFTFLKSEDKFLSIIYSIKKQVQA